MRQFKTNIIAVAALVSILTVTSCVNDLEQIPITDVTSASVFTDFGNYPMALAKIYGGFANGGQSANGGNSDINGIDGNFSQYTRILYSLQTLPTDEAVIAWNDGTLQTMHKMTWDSSSEFVEGAYYRLFTQIATSNEFLRNVTDEKLTSNNITGANLTEAKYMRAEVRYLRALSYFYALDLFGNVPFVDESYLPGSVNPPKRITRAELFNFVESELLAVAGELKDPKTNVYGRADKAAAWALLAKLYLNSNVYNGSNHYTDCITYCNKIIQAGYSLKPKYGDLFLADNDKNNPEVILPIAFDGLHTQTSGGTTFLIHASIGGSMPASNFGVSGGWGGLRTTKSYVNLFSGSTSDQRGNFYTAGQNLEINDMGVFTDGYGFIKFKNLTSGGVPGSDSTGNFCDADIPIFRLADVYLMYAEATLRGGSGGNITTALGYVNALRTRAGASVAASINTDYILDERGRELGWELTRRTDLIRYGKFTGGSYLWPWKGGVKDGKSVEEYRNLYPIPAKDIIANPNLIQNPGY